MNGRPFSLTMGRPIDYRVAVQLATGSTDPELNEMLEEECLIVTFQYKKGRSGILVPHGSSIPAALGLSIEVTDDPEELID